MKKLTVIIFILCALACAKKTNLPDDIAPRPMKLSLLKPNQDEPCINGTIISGAQSMIKFEWNTFAGADYYELTIKNLETSSTITTTVRTTIAEVLLLRNFPYSWSIIAKHDKSSESTKSDTWKFFNPGPGITFYLPYPADLLSPASGEIISGTSGKVTLSWKGAHPDGTIVGYSIYFGTIVNPPLVISDQTETTLKDVIISTGTTYYWKVITKDSKGNFSDSGIASFRTL